MAEQPLVPQEIQDQIDGKLPEEKYPITGNQRILDDLKNHCKSAYDNDLKWAKSYIEQDKEVSSRTE